MPMYQPATVLPEQSTVERDFFKSLSYLSKHYGLRLTNYRSLPYPHNILMTEKEVNIKLKTKGRYRELQIVEKDDSQICLSVRETFNHDFRLYYIPVMPIYDLWQKTAFAHCAELLTAVCAYLYIEADVTYYRDEETYMFYNYEILSEWITEGKDDMEKDDYKMQQSAYDKAIKQGNFIQEKMMATGFRHSLDSLIASFIAVSDFEKECLKIARNCWGLWQAFPAMNLFKHASLQNYEADDYEDNYIAMHEYFSFVGSVKDSVSDTLRGMVNNDFNERSRYQEPEIITFFDEPKPSYNDELAYEKRLFSLIDDLCTLIFNLP
jgi:hypothetical protein